MYLKKRPSSYIFLMVLLIATNGCKTQLTTIQQTCGSNNYQEVCTGQMEIPESRKDDFELAGTQAIDAIFSERFETDLLTFMDQYSSNPKIAGNWKGLEHKEIVQNLRLALPKSELGTYDGFLAWWKHLKIWKIGIGNKAYESNENYPARVNRWGLKGRSTASIANTIVHEVAHEAGMRHDGKFRECGPPYVIGNIVEKIADNKPVDIESLCKGIN